MPLCVVAERHIGTVPYGPGKETGKMDTIPGLRRQTKMQGSKIDN